MEERALTESESSVSAKVDAAAADYRHMRDAKKEFKSVADKQPLGFETNLEWGWGWSNPDKAYAVVEDKKRRAEEQVAEAHRLLAQFPERVYLQENLSLREAGLAQATKELTEFVGSHSVLRKEHNADKLNDAAVEKRLSRWHSTFMFGFFLESRNNWEETQFDVKRTESSFLVHWNKFDPHFRYLEEIPEDIQLGFKYAQAEGYDISALKRAIQRRLNAAKALEASIAPDQAKNFEMLMARMVQEQAAEESEFGKKIYQSIIDDLNATSQEGDSLTFDKMYPYTRRRYLEIGLEDSLGLDKSINEIKLDMEESFLPEALQIISKRKVARLQIRLDHARKNEDIIRRVEASLNPHILNYFARHGHLRLLKEVAQTLPTILAELDEASPTVLSISE